MEQRPRLLVIPSWYPSAANPLVGSAVREQGDLLQERYDVRVLFGRGHLVRYRTALRRYKWFPRPGSAKISKAEAGFIPIPPPAVAFEYMHHSVDEPALLDAMIDAYRQMLRRLIAGGWTPDILHAQSAESAGLVTARLAQEFDIPWVLTEHQVFVLAQYSEHRRQLMKDALRAATTLVAVSRHQQRCILLHGIHRPMVVVGNLVDEEAFRLVQPRREPKRFRILTVTYPHPLKDCETFFRAIALLLERGHRDIMVTIIGNESFRDLSEADTSQFERLAADYGVREVCRLIACAPRSAMPKHYAECDVFVSTSIAETFGIAVREAMTVGRPVVSTASGGVEDDLSAVNGVKVDILDHEAVAEALIAIKTGRLYFDPTKVRESVVAAHGRRAFLEQMTAVYEDAMAESKGRTPRV